MSRFNARAANIDDTSGSLPYLGPGLYTLRIAACRYRDRTRKGVPAYIVEFVVEESEPIASGADTPAPVGSSAAWVHTPPPYPGGENQWEASNVRFAAAVLRLQSREEIERAQADGSLDNALEQSIDLGVFNDLRVRCQVRERETRNGAVVTDYLWGVA